ncbi:flavin monoamine oxidase family protein [Cochlodiniinecator piscidefendens]|uniref:flavin monoamine oxidase family protein n=1 Tax=Cochlodiniinecator piscidefendens TaxID=2715756 RepID=UPI00140B0A95|nr:NAD(P)/FAD-dependent oxidoreductase [Cochlodiniinecator piscidefendens]
MTLTRRNTLKMGIAALLANVASKTSAQDMTGTKVVVVGAGIAGLAAAKQLQLQGAEVLVMEAGDYIGGRIRTDMSLGAPFEYGAGWIHGPSGENPIQDLAQRVDANTFVTDDDSLEVFDIHGEPLTNEDYERLDDMYVSLQRKLYSRVGRRDTRSIHEVIEDIEPDVLNDPMGRWMLSAFTEFDIGAGIEDISAANAFADTAFDGEDVILTGGYDTILAPLIDGLDIRLNSAVSQISYGEDGVEVDGIHADYVICAVPLGVLKAGKIDFIPALPQTTQSAIDEIGFGTVTKIALKFDRPFWNAETQYFGIMTEPKGRWNYWLNYLTFSNENILLGLSFGQYAPIADRMTQDEMTEDAIEVLRSVWGDAVGTPQTVLTTHWAEDPNFKGAYSYPQVGGSIAQYDSFGEPIADRLLMVGEHTIFDYHSTTHGALMSGRRAAVAISEL